MDPDPDTLTRNPSKKVKMFHQREFSCVCACCNVCLDIQTLPRVFPIFTTPFLSNLNVRVYLKSHRYHHKFTNYKYHDICCYIRIIALIIVCMFIVYIFSLRVYRARWSSLMGLRSVKGSYQNDHALVKTKDETGVKSTHLPSMKSILLSEVNFMTFGDRIFIHESTTPTGVDGTQPHMTIS